MARPAGRVQLGWWLTSPCCAEGWELVNAREHPTQPLVVLRCVACDVEFTVEPLVRRLTGAQQVGPSTECHSASLPYQPRSIAS